MLGYTNVSLYFWEPCNLKFGLRLCEDDNFKVLLDVMVWSSAAINRFWRLVYGSSTWLSRPQAVELVRDGFAFSESGPRLYVSKPVRGWLLYIGRPDCQAGPDWIPDAAKAAHVGSPSAPRL